MGRDHPITRLGQGADLIIVCPATARLISTETDDLEIFLAATLLAAKVMISAMHAEMGTGISG